VFLNLFSSHFVKSNEMVYLNQHMDAKLIFPWFPIFGVRVSHIVAKENNVLTIKWPSFIAKMSVLHGKKTSGRIDRW
jgi:hypothetical protein